MKKWLVCILLFVTSAGTFFPCCLADDCGSEPAVTSHTNNDDRKEGNCSPFFSCASCPGSVEVLKPFEMTEPEASLPIHCAHYKTLLLPDYSACLLQPPRHA